MVRRENESAMSFYERVGYEPSDVKLLAKYCKSYLMKSSEPTPLQYEASPIIFLWPLWRSKVWAPTPMNSFASPLRTPDGSLCSTNHRRTSTKTRGARQLETTEPPPILGITSFDGLPMKESTKPYRSTYPHSLRASVGPPFTASSGLRTQSRFRRPLASRPAWRTSQKLGVP